MIPGYSKFYWHMTPGNYTLVEPHLKKMTQEIPAALAVAVELEKKKAGAAQSVIRKYRTILNSFVAISTHRESVQEERVSELLTKFENHVKKHGIDLSATPISGEGKHHSPSQNTDTLEANWEAKLDKIVGLEQVKAFVRNQYKMKKADILREQNGIETDSTQSLNMVFAGNPGTGKTTMARLVAEMFHELGILEKGHLVEVGKADLVAGYVGQTAQKTKDVFMSALGGILFIDEAYSLMQGGENDFGKEAITTLTGLIDNHQGKIAVILAGYPHEMHELINKGNAGLKSKFPFYVNFPDYTNRELHQIGAIMFSGRGFTLTDDAITKFNSEIAARKRITLANGGNARLVRNLVEEVICNQSVRIVDTACAPNELNVIIPQDINSIHANEEQFDLESALSEVVGLTEIKQHIRALSALLKIREERKKAGLPVDRVQTMHTIFTGNPGTGKTMMARIFTNVLYSMGYTGTNKLVEVSKADLVAGYVGQTAMKTQDVIESAVGGVLFIDEAYALAQGGQNDFGQEAIDTLVKLMDDNRDKLVVVLAGYTHEMGMFLEANSGLKSRFSNTIEFPDYAPEELLEIAKLMYAKHAYELSTEALNELKELFAKAAKATNFGNGRFVRNVYEKSLNTQALRLSTTGNFSVEALKTITAEDIKAVDVSDYLKHKPHIGFGWNDK